MYWPIVFLQHTFKWDMLDISLQWRYFVSECFNNGVLPTWNPFMNSGFPQQADPQTWYPVSALLGFLFRKYSLYVLHLEYSLHLIIGFTGFYHLSKQWKATNETALLAGVVYVGSGFFVGNGSHLGWIISAAYSPWLFYHWHKFIQHPTYSTSLAVALLNFFILTGGYPAFFIVNAYLQVGFLIVAVFQHRKKDVIPILLVGISFFSMAALPLVASFEMKNQLARNLAEGNHYLYGAVNWQGLLSLFVPFVSAANNNWLESEQTMVNLFFGTIPLVFAVLAAFQSKRKFVVLLVALFFLATSMGSITPIRTWLFEYVPFMNLFRFPGLFRLYFIGSMLLLFSGEPITSFLQSYKLNRVSSAVLLLLASLFILLFASNYNSTSWTFFTSFSLLNFEFFNEAQPNDLIAVNALLALVSLAFFTLGFFSKNKSLLIGSILFELVVGFYLVAPSLLVDQQSPKEIEAFFTANNSGFEAPSTANLFNDEAILAEPHILLIWRNKQVLSKIPSPLGYSPYSLKLTDSNLPEGFSYDSLLAHPFVFLAECDSQRMGPTEKRIQEPYFITWKKFTPNRYMFIVENSAECYATVLTKNYPGWHVKVNGEEKFVNARFSFNHVFLTAGINDVEFYFEPWYLKFLVPLWALGFLASFAAWLLLWFITARINR